MKSFTILIDTREQTPWTFPDTFRGFSVYTERATLPFGDYSLKGYEDRIFIERKAHWDEIAGNLGKHRDRFHREFQKAKDCDVKQLIVCNERYALGLGQLRTRMHPNALWGSVLGFCEQYGVFLYDARSEAAGMRHCLGVFYRFLQREERKG